MDTIPNRLRTPGQAGVGSRLAAFARRVAHFEEAARAAPGTRFVARYEARVTARGSARRPSRVALAALLFTVGMLNVFVPGPGGSIFIFASALVLSAESRRFARLLDRGELRFARQVRWMLVHPVVVTVVISTIVIGATVVAGLVATS